MSSALAYASSRLEVLTSQIDEGTKSQVAKLRAAEAAKYTPGAKYQNWSKLGACHPDTHALPDSLEDVVNIVKKAKQLKQKVRVSAGSGHSYNGCNYTDSSTTSVMVHMKKMRRILNVDSSAMTISCEAGVTIAEMCDALRLNHLQLKCMPSITNLSLGGILATATHGSGINTPSIVASLVAMTVVNGHGDVVEFSLSKNAEELKMAACHLGLLGVVTHATLSVERRQVMRAHHNVIPMAKVGSVLAQRVTMNEYYRFWWIPHTESCYECTVNRVSPGDEDGAMNNDTASAGGRSIQTTKTTASDSNVRSKLQVIAKVLKRGQTDNEAHQADYKEYLLRQQTLQAHAARFFRGNWMRHNVVEASLYTAIFTPCIQPCINKLYQKIFLNHEEIKYGSPEELITFDCLFPQHGIEWAIEAHRAIDAFELVQSIIRTNPDLKVHFPVEFRFSDKDGCGVSPAFDRKVCWVGLVMFRPYMHDATSTAKYYQLFAEGMERLGGRPHWSKASPWTAKDYQKAYGKQWRQFLALRHKMDPENMFVNAWAKLLLE